MSGVATSAAGVAARVAERVGRAVERGTVVGQVQDPDVGDEQERGADRDADGRPLVGVDP